jgi:hypothetical protein
MSAIEPAAWFDKDDMTQQSHEQAELGWFKQHQW